MKKEIELKFKIESPLSVGEKLKKAKAKFLGKVFERTFRFDTKSNDLKKQGKFLRVKVGFKNTLTFKRKAKLKDLKFKEREEIELEISDPKKMEIILRNLGFTKMTIMEKYRQKWHLKNAEISIDRLPKMGNFVEIEGKKKAIRKVVKILGLNFKDGITATYWDLWEDYRKKKGIKNENIIFNK